MTTSRWQPFSHVATMRCALIAGLFFAAGPADARVKKIVIEKKVSSHDGYVRAVEKAAARAMAEGFLLKADADALVAQANTGNVLKP